MLFLESYPNYYWIMFFLKAFNMTSKILACLRETNTLILSDIHSTTFRQTNRHSTTFRQTDTLLLSDKHTLYHFQTDKQTYTILIQDRKQTPYYF